MQVSESSGGVLRQSSEEVQKVNKREDHSDLWPPVKVWGKMIKDFVIEYVNMEVHSANITAGKYENQKFQIASTYKSWTHGNLKPAQPLFWYFFFFFISLKKQILILFETLFQTFLLSTSIFYSNFFPKIFHSN